jgi:hypothetical protein
MVDVFNEVEVEMEDRREEEAVENKENDEFHSAQFRTPAQPPSSPSVSQFGQPPSPFVQISLACPPSPPLGISPIRSLCTPLSAVETVMPLGKMNSKQWVRQRRKARDQKRRQKRQEAREAGVTGGDGVIGGDGVTIDIGSGSSHVHIGPITLNLTRQ